MPTWSSRWIFDTGAAAYGWLTWQDTWRAHCRSLVDHFPPDSPAPRVLDLGVGPGVSAISILERLPAATVVGVDFSPRMLAVARRYLARAHASVELIEADAARLPLDDASFDVVTGHSFLYIVPDAAAVLREAARVLRPGGACVFLEPHEHALPLAAWRVPGGARFKMSMAAWRLFSGRRGRFDRDRLHGLLAHDFQDVAVTSTLAGAGLLARGVRGCRPVDEVPTGCRRGAMVTPGDG